MHSLFIGLGGAGTYAVAELKKKMLDFGYDVSQDNFLFIDTDQKIKDEYDFIGDDFISLSGDGNESYSVNSVRNDAQSNANSSNKESAFIGSHFLTWFDDKSSSLVSNRDLTKGAEGVRMFTRVMLWKNRNIKSRIQTALSYPDANNVMQSIENIYLISGTCGGTGSGSVLDIMYMLGELKEQNQRNTVNLKLNTILVMPHGYISELSSEDVRSNKYQTNAYAMLDEINSCFKNHLIPGEEEGKGFFKYRCMGEKNQVAFDFSVCENLFMFDSYDNVNLKGALSHSQVSDNVANFLFAMESGSAAAAITGSNFCNITNTQIQSTASLPFIKGFCSTGMYTVQTWEEIVRKYVREKFIYQMFQHGFIGSDSFRLTTDDRTWTDANNSFSDVLKSLKKEFDEKIQYQIDQIFEVDKTDTLKTIAENLINALSTKENKIDEIFLKHPKKEAGEELHELVGNYLKEVKNSTYSFCMELVKKYSLRHVIALIDKLDKSYDDSYKTKRNEIEDQCNKVINSRRIKLKNTNFQDCKDALSAYFEYIVARNLSNENDGYLDGCRKCLTEAAGSINVENRELPGCEVVIKKWETDFQKYLNGLKADRTRMLIPRLPDELLEQKGNELAKRYEALVLQENDGPNLSWDENDSNLLYTYKQKVMKELLRENGSWESSWFVIDNNSTFSQNCSTILDAYLIKVVKKANELSLHGSLAIPFMGTYNNLDLASKKNVIDNLVQYDRINLSLTKNASGSNAVSGQTVYLTENLDPNAGLGIDLFDRTSARTSGGQMGVAISDSVISDRIIKLYVRSGYGFDDYEFFMDYQRLFEGFYSDPEGHNKHQCYIHKDFLDARLKKMTLNDLFDVDVKETSKKSLRNLWKGNEGVVFRFAILYMVKLLKDQKDTDLMKRFNPLNGFVKEKEEKAKKKWEITLGQTNDLKNNPTKTKYSAVSSTTINMLKDYTRGQIEPYIDCLKFWLDILERLSKDNDNFLTTTKICETVLEACQKLNENLNPGQQNALTSVFNRYAVGGEGDGGNDSLRVDIEDWNYKDFFKDCLLGLFDKS